MIRLNRLPRKPYKLIKHERGITVAEDCALVVEDCTDIRIEGGYVDGADRNGIYLKRNCFGIEIRHNPIYRAGAAGIYIDSGCSNNLIEDTEIADCGYWISQRDIKKYPFDLWRFGLLKREGIAIDDASYNTVRGVTLRNNALAGVTLYRNCGEFCSFKRGAGANDNLVEECDFIGSKVGIWNAAREWRDMHGWDCLESTQRVALKDLPDLPYDQRINWSAVVQCLEGNWMNPFRTYIERVPDRAFRNTFQNNTFSGVEFEIINHS